MGKKKSKPAASNLPASAIARARRKLPDLDQLRRARPATDDYLPRTVGLGEWRMPRVLAVRNEQARGVFREPALLLRSAKTDPAVFAALLNRIAPQMCLEITVEPCADVPYAARARAARALADAKKQFVGDESAISPAFRAEINETLAIHGVAFAQNVWLPRKDGTQVDVRLEVFPIEFVRWFEIAPDGGKGFYALVLQGVWIPIVHGDGQWVVITTRELEPWTFGAMMPLAALWADRAFAVNWRGQSARSHGDSKWIGTLPAGVKTTDAGGVALINEMDQLYELQRSMIKPFGSVVERDEAMSQNWQIFRDIIASDNADVFKILTGQEPRGDSSQRLSIAQLFGVSQDVVGSDVGAMARGINTGTVRPWSARNYGRIDLVKGIRWLMPDPEEDARIKSIADRTDSFNDQIEAFRKNGFSVTQDLVNALAKTYRIHAPPLATRALSRADISSDDIRYGIVTINEVRATLNLPAIPGGDVTVPQSALVEKVATSPTIPVGSTPAPGGGQPPASGT